MKKQSTLRMVYQSFKIVLLFTCLLEFGHALTGETEVDSLYPKSVMHHHEMHDASNSHKMSNSSKQTFSDSSIYNLASTWIDENRDTLKLSDLYGKIQVITMVYTSCQYACPLIMMDMEAIRKKIPAAILKKVHFTLATFDPSRDSVEALLTYKKLHKLPEKSYTFLNGNEESILELAAVLGIKYKQLPSGDFSHSNVITILDQNGKIIHQQIGLNVDPKESLKTIKRLAKNRS